MDLMTPFSLYHPAPLFLFQSMLLNMPKQLNRPNEFFEWWFIPYPSSNILHRVTQSSRRSNESANWLPIGRHPLDIDKSLRHNLGPCHIICSSCHVMHWIQERSYKSMIHDPLFFTCCRGGRILIPSFPDAPEPLRSLLLEQTDSTSLSDIFISSRITWLIITISCKIF